MPTAPYGSWRSEITAARVAAGGTRVYEPSFDSGDLYWLEDRPDEDGRTVLVRMGEEVLPRDCSVRSRVHEYGGGSYLVSDGVVYYVEMADQRIWRMRPGAQPEPLTPEGEKPGNSRYADFALFGDWLIAVRERHGSGSGDLPVNDICAVSPDGDVVDLIAGSDFYSSPRTSRYSSPRTSGASPPRSSGASPPRSSGAREAAKIAWIEWDLPEMPWDSTRLVTGEIRWNTDRPGVFDSEIVAEGASICQPEWSGETLFFVSDRTGWWNLYRDGEPVFPVEAECATPAWLFRFSSYALTAHGAVAAYASGDRRGLALIGDSSVREIETDRYPDLYLVSDGVDQVAWIGSAPYKPTALLLHDLRTDRTKVVRELDSVPSPSVPRFVSFPSGAAGDREAHAWYYPPRNPEWGAPEGELPPLMVISHGGPTSSARVELRPAVQFWTSRGFAVVDVDYTGSSGYGREYRQALYGNWGVVDVEDCIAAAEYLAAEGLVDPERMVIRGGSAGGYTTLCALAFHDVFAAGASYYGVGDLKTLTEDTHKFESRYLDKLIAPYPDPLYDERSPINAVESVSCPVIVFQGSEDKVVPPEQAEEIVEALAANGIPHAYLLFEGEAHGFRKAENIARALEAELYFYGYCLGFEPADEIEPVAIAGSGRASRD